MWGTRVSQMQSKMRVRDNKISGMLKYLDEGQIVNDWGPGYFMALQFSDIDPNATSVLVGMDPSQSSGLVEIINDPDKNGVFKVLNNSQNFKVVLTDGTHTLTQIFDLSGLHLSNPDPDPDDNDSDD